MMTTVSKLTPYEAKWILTRSGIFPTFGKWPDFYELRWEQKDELGAFSRRVRYRQPANANGSRMRYFYEAVLRRAR